MYKVRTQNEIVEVFDTVLEALAYCVNHHWLKVEPNGEFLPLEIDT